VTAARDSTNWVNQGHLRMRPVDSGCHHPFR
jgi:hypothetical protein